MSATKWVRVPNYQFLITALDNCSQIEGAVMLNYGARSSKTFFKNVIDGEIVYEMNNQIDDTDEVLTEERVAEYINAGALWLELEV